MDIGAIGAAIWSIFLVFALVFYCMRYRSVRKKGFRPSYSDLGNALQQLQRIPQPRVEYVLQEKLKDEAEQDDQGGPKDPTQGTRRH
jgi:hypothetical protein